MLACVVAATTGCDDLFNLEEVSLPADGKAASTLVPLQTVMTARDQGTAVGPIVQVVPTALATTPGHELVITAVVETSSFAITSITDDGGNTWTRILEGQDPAEVDDVRLEIWHSTGVQSTSFITVTVSADRELGVIFTEWNIPGEVVATLGGVFAVTAMPTSGAMTTDQRGLLLASMAYKSGVPPEPSDTTLVSINQAGLGGVNVGAWYRELDAGTYETSWMLGAPVATVTGLVSFTLE